MKYYLLKMNTSGIKNLDREIELKFYKQILNKDFKPNKYNVKAIYGANGAGKTALIYAAEIYRKFVLNRDYLALYNSNNSLTNLINQNKKEMFIKMTFAVLSDDYKLQDVYAHTIVFYNQDGRYQVKNEILQKLKGFRLNDETKYKTLYKVQKGEITTENTTLKEMCKNVVIDRSVISNTFEYCFNNREDVFFDSIVTAGLFAQSMTVMLYSSDKNYINFDYITRQVDMLSKYKKEMDKGIFSQLLLNQSLIFNDEIPINKNKYEEFAKNIKNLCKFIQVFKPELKNIAIKKDEKGKDYICNLIFEYSNGLKISRQYESTGIKKLMSIYYALCNVERGGIVFIDELDANIHDVILIKLVDYIREYTKGQLIFTTHNLGPMDVLQKDKCSIDFISNDSRITSWTSFGNSSAANVYRKGLIKYSPFNIESFNFLGVFGDE
ncbi:MAG: ATP-binding protein [Clostridia bacterium]|nr:ATP-binding protein [Clostridia bacterium]